MSERVLQAIRERLGDVVQDIQVRSPRRIYVNVAPDRLVEAARCLFADLGGRYAIATGMQVEGGFEVLHHFAFDADHVVVSLRARVDGREPRLDSLAPLIKGAEFIEREMHDLLGIEFRGHPNLQRLILPEDWPDGVYPLRRDAAQDDGARRQL
jgi:NADH-quinone oxidoreductase subunit C